MDDEIKLTGGSFDCPFCDEKGDFDKQGLKYHLYNYCEVFSKVDISDW